MVEFVSYTGKYPNLCSGVLTLNIDGVEVKFGYDYQRPKECENYYIPFWHSGGAWGFYNDWSESYISHNEWIVDEDELPAKYKKYINEIEEAFNANVPYGCCGGCL